MERIDFKATLHSALHFHVLSHLDLGQDAASLFNASLEPRDWVDGLLSAYRNAPGRLALQFLGIQTSSLDGLREQLRYGSVATGLADETGRTLRAAFLAALDLERHDFSMAWNRDAAERQQRLVHTARSLGERLDRLRSALWEGQAEPPPLTVLDCPALGLNGRAATCRGRRVVAANLAGDLEHALLQIFHEEIHPVTDPGVLEQQPDAPRDTHVDGDGYAAHLALEQAAVTRGREVVHAVAPDLSDGYEVWAGRFGLAIEPR